MTGTAGQALATGEAGAADLTGTAGQALATGVIGSRASESIA
ncbi:hypothetical protein ACFFR3_05515 [Nonomuraea salmonea]|uniref:Uncharacterized protein n=1 Tax=Nonomuraea salmonea TaxID=46181 RepID=A0ABV5NF76_9ACTN